VVFDIGGVLLDWDPRHLYRKVFDDEDTMERFLATVCTAQWHDPHDRGESTEQSCAALARSHPHYAEQIWAWHRRSEEMVAGPIEPTVAILAELSAAAVPCYALTNMEVETFPRRAARYGFFALFEGVVVSGFEKMAKPDPEIFELLVRRFGLARAATLFIDDNPANLDTAAACGLVTHHYDGPVGLRRHLEEAGLLTASSSVGPAPGG